MKQRRAKATAGQSQTHPTSKRPLHGFGVIAQKIPQHAARARVGELAYLHHLARLHASDGRQLAHG